MFGHSSLSAMVDQVLKNIKKKVSFKTLKTKRVQNTAEVVNKFARFQLIYGVRR
jgi:hypothetical protein